MIPLSFSKSFFLILYKQLSHETLMLSKRGGLENISQCLKIHKIFTSVNHYVNNVDNISLIKS